MNVIRILNPIRLPLLATLAVICLTGCDAPPGPVVNLVSARIDDASALQTTATFTLRLINEQPRAVTFDGAVHKLYINGLFVGEGLSSETVTLDRLSATTRPVTVYLDNIALATRLKSIIENESFDYRVQSLFYGTDPKGKLHATSDGRLALKDFQPSATNSVSTNAPPKE